MKNETVTFEVHVTEEDIRSGDRCCSLSCPLARAIVRAAEPFFGEGVEASVGSETASIFRGGPVLGMVAHGNLGEDALQFRRDFDSEEGVQSDTFLLELEICDANFCA